MPALDQCHHQVVRALQKDGWVITDQPLYLSTEKRQVYIDIGAQQSGNGSRKRIAVIEVKCFLDTDKMTTDLYIAVGQYLFYRAVIADRNINAPLYLSVPENIYNEFFDAIARTVMSENQIKLVIVNLETETIAQWIE